MSSGTIQWAAGAAFLLVALGWTVGSASVQISLIREELRLESKAEAPALVVVGSPAARAH